MQANSSVKTLDGGISSELSHVVRTSFEDPDVKNLLHPAIHCQFKAVRTEPDNNCLYNAICLCLGLPQTKQMEFRNLTVATILENRSHFQTILTPERTNETIESLIDSCLKPDVYEGWGNEFHLQALSIALNRNIFVYSSFRYGTAGRFYQNKRLNISELSEKFTKKSAQTSQHLNYQPAQGIYFRSPICLFYNQGHYTALIPRSTNPMYCVPYQVIVQSINTENIFDLQMQDIASQSGTSNATISSLNTALTSQSTNSKRGQSRWSKWYANLSPVDKIEYNKKKANRRNAQDINKKYYQKHAETLRAQESERQKKLYEDPIEREKIKTGSKKRQQKMYEDHATKEKKKAKSRERNRRLYEDPTERNKLKTESRERQKKMYAEQSTKEKIKAQKRKRQKETYADEFVREHKKAKSRERKRKLYEDPIEKSKMKAESRERQKLSYLEKKDIKLVSNRKSAASHRKQKKTKANDFNYALELARSAMKEFPSLACTVCHRARFKEQVKQCKRTKYGNDVDLQKAMTGDYVHNCDSGCSNMSNYHEIMKKEWICFTCDRHLLKGTIPPQAVVNGLSLDPIPEELKILNPLEKHLISIIQAFAKIVPLPKGGQKGIRGQMVCVPADLQKTADSLPWSLDTNSLIRVKLKRKLQYKGHHLFMTVSQKKIMAALSKLKEINPKYKDMQINDNWMQDMIERGYTQLVDELHTPTLEEQYEVYMESQKEEELMYAESCRHDNVSYEVYLDCQKEEEVEYMEKKYGKEMLESWKLHKETIDEIDEMNLEDQTKYEIMLEEEQEFLEEYKEHLTTDLQKQYDAYVDDMDNTIVNMDNTNSKDSDNIHPLDKDIEHPFQISSFQHADPSAVMSDGDIMCFAPSEGNRPVNALQSEAMCYPVLFPQGNKTYLTQTEGGEFTQDRERNISITQYFDSRVLSIDNRFQADSEWIFFAQYLKEAEQIHNAASIALKKGPSSTRQGQKVTAGDLVNNDKLTKSVLRNNIGYRYLKDTRGTPPFWETTMKGLFAGFKQIGPPTYFISFSAADRRWPEITQAILSQQGKDTDMWDKLTWSEYCDLINNHPVTAVLMFERRVQQFVKLMTSESKPLGGKVVDMFLRREIQERGWPHIHAMIWIEDAPSPEADDKEHIDFIEKAICCSLPNSDEDSELNEIITSVQRHSRNHSKTCFKNRSSDCRFGYPLPISSTTYVLRPCEPPKEIKSSEWQENATKLVKKVKGFLTSTQDLENYTVEDVLTACNTNENEYKEALRALCKRDQIILKRSPSEAWINFYNKDLIRFWNGNMDIQYIYNPYACAKYCLSYIAKAEREMGDLLRKAQFEARAGNMDAVNELHHLGDIYLTHRSVSIMEAIYRLTHLPLKTFTRDVIFIPVDDLSYRFSLPLKVLTKKNKDSSEIWTANIVDRYLARPNTEMFNNMTLAEFAVDYQKAPFVGQGHNAKKQKSKKDIYKLRGNMGFIQKRGKRAIFRYYKGNVDKEPDRYYKNLIRLYYPHRKLELMSPYKSYEEMFFVAYQDIRITLL